jgi:putative ABC transport system substrate-binding protein
LGYVEGKNLVLEARYARGQYDVVPQLASDLLQQNVDVIAVIGAVIVRAAKAVVKDKPLVFTIVVDPVAEQVVSALKHPGGNITGVTNFDPLQASKRIALLQEVRPNLAQIAVLSDRGVSDAQLRSAEAAALTMGAYSARWRTRFHADGGQCSTVIADTVPR